MKTFGVVLFLLGIVAAIASFSMDASIVVSYGEKIIDAGLAFDRQNYIIGSSLIALCGALIWFFGKK
ncbi:MULTISPECIES: hypothetical protein [unclassified Providencia]|uniref:hypothetical protein n=1 Tax=unclassified Providencia TaxID=2633465 RepID=UPI000E985B14|nr:hypothetical protein [Providencia sp.]MBP6080706.1 hypothetical protein [Providencia sp.]HBO23758.1 hypothetical protein [Providencia sp.]